ncbi:NAD(P)H-dependent oxidoreductase [Iodobacter sp. HSC-16F04]|uniref:NAD(P)H-dependent oxidoreductase n=1 Tax=Iodobacter violaceini TaxID=3044271 RepID=A0ABX0KMN6_9NEIS|nr:NAD(P)H-dependent oxidoreductase [Iodobacter violacea]NHQ84654.1 NAD(P)H-dependent oxidoreductase [Iodobacter violacea]
MATAIILGSARNHGNTHQLALQIANHTECVIFNLADYNISHYDYEHKNIADDFLPLVREIITFDRFILATPIYWYSPSSIMKIFMDRLTDLITIEQSIGRQLKNKSAAIISTGNDKIAPQCFEDIFRLTFQHLHINYLGMLYCPCNKDPQQHKTSIISHFIQQLKLSKPTSKK